MRMRWFKPNLSLLECLSRSNFDKDVEIYGNALKRACRHIREQLVSAANDLSDDQIAMKQALNRILTEYDFLYDSMKLK